MSDDSPKKFITFLNNKRNEVESQIKKIEKIIFDNETKYLEATVNGGNIFRGWEHIFTSKSKFNHNLNPGKRPRISNNERVFSQTSVNNYCLKEDVVMNLNNNVNKYKENGINPSQNNINSNSNQKNSFNKHKKKIKSLSIKKNKLGNYTQKDKKVAIMSDEK